MNCRRLHSMANFFSSQSKRQLLRHICRCRNPCPQSFPNYCTSTSKKCTTILKKKTNNATSKNEIEHQNANSKSSSSSAKSLKARTLARVINAGTWSSQLEGVISKHTPLSQTTVLQTLRLLKTPSKALHFFNWAANQPGFTHPHQSYFLILELLGKARNLNPARNFLFSIPKRSKNAVKLDDKFFNSLIRSYGRAGLFQESIKVFKTMKSLGISPSVVTFNNLFSVLLKRGRTGMAFELYDEMLRTYGVKPDLYTFNILIRGFCMNSMINEGFRLFKEMERFECEPDLITYNTIMDGLCRCGKVNIARNVMKGLLNKGTNLSPNVVSYTTLIRGHCKKQEVDEALEVFKEMVEQGLKPNEITYNTLIQGLCEARKFDTIREIMDGAVGGGGFVPDTCTFTTLMNAHCSTGNLVEAFKVLERMLELEVQPDSATYSVLIRSLCQKKDFSRAEKLFLELAEKEILLHDDGCRPLVASYNPMFEYLCRNGKTKMAERVFRQLMRRGTQDPSAYKTLIMGHCKEGTFKDGHALLVFMLRRNFVPDVETYESLIEGLLQKGEPILAYDTLEKMLKSSHLPRTSVFHQILEELIKKNCTSASASLTMLMLEKNIRQNISLSTATVKALFKSNMGDKAFEIVKCLYDSGYMVNIEEVLNSLCQNRKLLEANKLVLFSLEKNQHVDIDMCSSLLIGLCKIHKVKEAFGIFFEMLERGFHLPLTCLKDLIVALETEGRSKEAEFVAKKMQNQLQLER